MGDGDNSYVSKPPVDADLTVLCVDGTSPTDSAAFFNYLQAAGKRIKKTADRVNIQNLLALISGEMSGTINAPAGTNGDIFPFGPERMKTLPIKKTALPGTRARIAHVLLPQGEVTGDKTDFADTLLGATADERKDAAKRNSDLLMRLCLAPGVSNAGTASAYVDFANGSNTSTDIMYLSGHGSMAGSLAGEADWYMHYFQLLLLINPEFIGIAKATLVPPLWIVIGACFSMRQVHGEIWLRFFQNQSRTLRGILGYQTVSPLADASAEINRRFANALADGKTFIEAWQLANGGNDGWTALAFDHAKNDTLTYLRDLKRGTVPSDVPAPQDRQLRFYEQRSTAGVVVGIELPVALFEIHRWDTEMLAVGEPGEPIKPEGMWLKSLVTNLDFTKDAFEAEAEKSAGKYVSNASWASARSQTRLTDLGLEWHHRFEPTHFYAIVMYPPFIEPFKDGFQDGDQIEFSLVHVRQTYPKAVDFTSIFDLLFINGQKQSDVKHDIPAPNRERDKQSSKVRNRLRFACPLGNSGFEPARFVVRYRKENASKGYLWFWFAVKIERGGKTIFEKDFDTFVMEAASHGFLPQSPSDPVPDDGSDVWKSP